MLAFGSDSECWFRRIIGVMNNTIGDINNESIFCWLDESLVLSLRRLLIV